MAVPREMLAEWDSERNSKVDPLTVNENSATKAWWICSKDRRHKWEAAIRGRCVKGYGCPFCSGKRVLREESFGALYPEIAKELDLKINRDLDPFSVKPGSNKRVTWRCSENQSHTWSTTIVHRTKSRAGYPKCSKKRTSMADLWPQFASEWDSERNGKEYHEVFNSTKGALWWKCEFDQSHTWQATLSTRQKGLGRCPYCNPRKQHRSRLPTLSEGAKNLLEEWDFSKNTRLDPNVVTLGSSKVASWICRKNSAHKWDAPINERTRKNRGCPHCLKRWVSSKDRSLAVKFPNIAREWHPTKNGKLKPNDISFGSKKLVWWKCAKGHEWEKTVTGRTQRNSPCPFCPSSKEGEENTLKARFPRVAAQWHPSRNGSLTPEDVTAKSGKKVWWICDTYPEHEWETQIKNRTVLNTGCPFCARIKHSVQVKGQKFQGNYKSTEPFKTLLISLTQIVDLVRSSNLAPENEQTLYRMSHAAIIASLETYLNDLFILLVIRDTSSLKRVLTTDPEYRSKKYSLDEVLQFSSKFEQSVINTLDGFIWHNLARAEKKFKSVLKIEFDQSSLKKLMKAVGIRHDIVHRNGRNKKGAIVKLTSHDLESTIEEVCHFTESVEAQLPTRSK